MNLDGLPGSVGLSWFVGLRASADSTTDFVAAESMAGLVIVRFRPMRFDVELKCLRT